MSRLIGPTSPSTFGAVLLGQRISQTGSIGEDCLSDEEDTSVNGKLGICGGRALHLADGRADFVRHAFDREGSMLKVECG